MIFAQLNPCRAVVFLSIEVETPLGESTALETLLSVFHLGKATLCPHVFSPLGS
jgi:hypothetical protein